MGKLIKWLRLRLVVKLFPAQGYGACSNRWWQRVDIGHHTVELTFLDNSKPTTYSREEVIGFLKIVRREEKRTGWTCPEPELGE